MPFILPLQLALVMTPEVPVCCAAFNPWDDSLLAVAAPHNVRSYRLDLATAAAKPNNLLMLVSSSWYSSLAIAGVGCKSRENRPAGTSIIVSASCMAVWSLTSAQL
jgi:hypothetical protein